MRTYPKVPSFWGTFYSFCTWQKCIGQGIFFFKYSAVDTFSHKVVKQKLYIPEALWQAPLIDHVSQEKEKKVEFWGLRMWVHHPRPLTFDVDRQLQSGSCHDRPYNAGCSSHVCSHLVHVCWWLDWNAPSVSTASNYSLGYRYINKGGSPSISSQEVHAMSQVQERRYTLCWHWQ